MGLCVLGIVGAVVLQAADVTGKWTAQVPGRNGQTREATFVFKQEGAKLTGTTSGRQGDTPIADGKVEGDTISFTVTRSFNGNEVKLLYKGTVTANEIKFTQQREGGEPREFTAKRSN
jgi:hypothetical protein